MKHLIKFNLIKKKAKLRSYFSKPSSAIFMGLIIFFLGGSLVSMLFMKPSSIMDDGGELVISLSSLFMVTFFIFASVLPNRRSLFFEEDSYYLFIGPYTNKQLLLYASIDLIFQSFLASVFLSVFVYYMGSAFASVPVLFYIMTIIVISLIIYIISMVVQWIYLRDLIDGFKSKKKYFVLGALIVSVIAVLLIALIKSNWNIGPAMQEFIMGTDFYFVPLLGWMKMAQDYFLAQNYVLAMIPVVGMIALSVLITIPFINTKGYFFEQAMIDAVDFTEYYKQAMAGKQVEKHKKIGDANVKFGKYSKAILSKNWLILKKTKRIFKMNDIMGIFFVQVLAFSFNAGAVGYVGIIALYLMSNVDASMLKDELQSNYTYLIPDKPMSKMKNILIIPMAKSAIFVIACLLIPLAIQRISAIEFIALLLVNLSVMFVFYAAHILSLRVLKSRDNLMAQQMIVMLMTMLYFVPSVIIGLLFYFITGDILNSLTMVVPIVVIVNLGLSLGTIYLCSSMVSQNALNQD